MIWISLFFFWLLICTNYINEVLFLKRMLKKRDQLSKHQHRFWEDFSWDLDSNGSTVTSQETSDEESRTWSTIELLDLRPQLTQRSNEMKWNLQTLNTHKVIYILSIIICYTLSWISKKTIILINKLSSLSTIHYHLRPTTSDLLIKGIRGTLSNWTPSHYYSLIPLPCPNRLKYGNGMGSL